MLVIRLNVRALAHTLLHCLVVVGPGTQAAMAGTLKKHSMPALGWWLMAVGAFRSTFTWSCFLGSASLCSASFSEIQGACSPGNLYAKHILMLQ